jgi:hypothetical protein
MAAAVRRPGGNTPVHDVTLGDEALRDACQDARMGRWQGPRDLLHATDRDWDRRMFRIRVLADAMATTRVAESWQIADPASTDAVVLRAEVEVMRVFRMAGATGQVDVGHLVAALQAASAAAERYPQDPVPWVSMLTLARLYPGGRPEIHHWLDQLQDRDLLNREGYHQFLRYHTGRYHGSFQASYDFALEAVQFAPKGSPLAVLPQVARAEHYRHKIAAQSAGSLGQADFWSQPSAVRDLEVAMRRWVGNRVTPYAQDVSDLNFLAHGLCYAYRFADAKVVFGEIGNVVTTVPWSYCGEPLDLFGRWRERALAQPAWYP